jgi:hypothetical protein
VHPKRQSSAFEGDGEEERAIEASSEWRLEKNAGKMCLRMLIESALY